MRIYGEKDRLIHAMVEVAWMPHVLGRLDRGPGHWPGR
jgi:hypothetical protein